MTKKTQYHKSPRGMPSLTIDGKRAIIVRAQMIVGEKNLLVWLSKYDIHSIKLLNEHVRKHKAKFFRELYEFSERVASELSD